MRTEKKYVRWFLHFSLHTFFMPLCIFLRCAGCRANGNAFWLHTPKEAAGALNISSEHMQYMCPEERWKSSRVSCVTSTRSGLYIHGSPQREQQSSTSAAACTLPARNSTKLPRHFVVQQVVRDCGRLASRPASMPGSSWSDARRHGARERRTADSRLAKHPSSAFLRLVRLVRLVRVGVPCPPASHLGAGRLPSPA